MNFTYNTVIGLHFDTTFIHVYSSYELHTQNMSDVHGVRLLLNIRLNCTLCIHDHRAVC